MSVIHNYSDAHESVSSKQVEVSDEVLAKLATCSSGSLTTQLFKRGFRQPAFVGLRSMTRDVKPFPTGGCAGTTLTIMALTVRACAYISEQRNNNLL
ncbi:hypothetical protein [Pseudomonas sp. RC3H12]|uniref:hypothetical protein n=1 Tax=Pseudomonas sp. RC3H12 TaxID=2834406 RepID=UPI0020321F58|nr:hypothetical protein [Pseudomonas sp. RC3H12]